MQYNTTMNKIVLSEYGRNIQQMAQYILTIEDKAKRNQAANEIITVMGNMTPQYKDSKDFKQKLWDHLALMTNYELDVDYPYEITKKSDVSKKSTLGYSTNNIKLRHYGKIIQQMVIEAINIQDERTKKDLILTIANQMKKMYVQWNNNFVTDEQILRDLKIISEGKLSIDKDVRLTNVKTFTPNNNGTRPKISNKSKQRYKKK